MIIKSYPKYAITLPSGKKINFRPFTVKEENSLLVAKQSEENENILATLIDVMDNCFEDDIANYPVADFEYAFLQLRSKSIGELEKATINCPDTKEKVKVEINIINDMQIKNNQISNIINLDDIKLKLKPTTIKTILTNPNYNKSFDDKIKFIAENILSIQKENELIDGNDMNLQEKIEFCSNLSSKDFKKIIEYYDNSPKVFYLLKYALKDGTTKNIQLSGVFNLISFFLTI